jgi:hypothetical protein
MSFFSALFWSAKAKSAYGTDAVRAKATSTGNLAALCQKGNLT